MKKTIFMILFICSASLFAETEIKGELINQIAAKVNDIIITETDVQKAADELISMAEMRGTVLSNGEAYNEALNNLINENLIQTYAEKNDLEVDKERIKKAVDSRLQEIRSGFPNENEFTKALSSSGLTIFGLRTQLESQISRQMLYSNIINTEVRPNVEINNMEIKEYFEQNREEYELRAGEADISQLIIPFQADEETLKEAYAELNRVRLRVLNGESFEELAKEYSDDVGSAQYGGDLGYFSRGMMVPEFENTAFGLNEIGEISEIIKTQYGYHLIKLLGKQDNQVRAAHILIQTPFTEKDYVKIKEKASEVVKELRNGASFTETYRKYSGDEEGDGHIGEIELSALSPNVVHAIQNTLDRKYTDPIESESGMMIIKVDDVKAGEVSYKDFKEEIQNMLTNMQIDQKFEEFIEKLKKENYVEIMD